jgi:hypothetical protein
MENKLIHLFNKPRAKQRVEIQIDYEMDEDGWFLDVMYIENKTNKLAHKHCIILKDLNTWINSIKSEGWIESELPKTTNI